MTKAAWMMTTTHMRDDDDRPWENLPSVALLTIFRRIDFEERLLIVPLVCKSWRSVSEHPQCWTSMIPDSISPEDAFIKKPKTYLRKYHLKLDDKVAAQLTPTELALDVSLLKTLIKKSGGGDAITSLYLSPFISRCNRHKVLRLVADCCPNLKHISFLNRYNFMFSMEDVDELVNKCRRLELIAFGYGVRFRDFTLIQKLGNCLPHLRGIRIQTGGGIWYSTYSCTVAQDIAKYLPRLTLLNLACSLINDDRLSSILSGCLELQYLSVTQSNVSNMFEMVASAKIPEFHITRGCSICNDGDSDVADMSDFDQEEYAKHRTKLITYSYESYDDCMLEYDLSAGCYEETYKSYDYQYNLLKDGRSKAFYRGRAKDRKRRQFRLLYGRLRKCDGRQSKLKPLIECKMPYADDLYVMPVCN